MPKEEQQTSDDDEDDDDAGCEMLIKLKNRHVGFLTLTRFEI